MTDDEAVERKRQQLIEAATRGSPIGEGGPPDHATQGDAVIKSHCPCVELCPLMLRSSYIVYKVSDYQRPRQPMDEYALFQPETVDAQLIDNAGEGRLWRRAVDSINA